MVLVIVILNGGDGESNGNGDIDDSVLVRRNETKKETKKRRWRDNERGRMKYSYCKSNKSGFSSAAVFYLLMSALKALASWSMQFI